jgi:hypothetical protein
MSTIVWTTLITAVATLAGSLGGIWLKGIFDDKAQARQAEQSRSAAREDQQRQAYGELVATARLALRNFRQLRIAYTAGAPDIQAVKDALSQTDSLAAEMNKATALAELVGSPGGRKHAREIYDKAKACADLFQGHDLTLAAAPSTIIGKLLGPAIPGGIGKAIPFDAGKAKVLCDELAVAIDQFIDAVNTDLGQ